MRICFIPIDNRPVCYNLALDIANIDEDIELLLPPREDLGSLTKTADVEGILNWLSEIPKCDSIILSLDTVAYGGLVPSRRTEADFSKIKRRIENLKRILLAKDAKIYAFSSIMRISNNNYNEEEKEYWSKYGKKIFEYSYNFHKLGNADSSAIPQEILQDYLKTRERNFNINKIYLEWQKEGFFDTLIFSKDDCAEYGLNVMEAKELEQLGGFTKTGADEIPLSLLARSIKKNIKVYVKYTEPDCKDLISNYEDVSIEKSVNGQLELCGFQIADSEEHSDVVLIVNNFREKQGELVMGWDTPAFGKQIALPDKPFVIADVRYANGSDNKFVEGLLKLLPAKEFLGYAGWNTSANTLGSLLAELKVVFGAKKYNENSFKKLQMIRFLDDWAYQANLRKQIATPCDIREQMRPYAEKLSEIFGYEFDFLSTKYTYPWNRKFEVEITLK